MTSTIPTTEGLTIHDTVATEEFTIGCMSTLDRTGDMRTMWDSRNPEEVKAAKKQFKDLKDKGYLAYKAVGKDGRKGEVISEFDPTAERIIFVRQNVGG